MLNFCSSFLAKFYSSSSVKLIIKLFLPKFIKNKIKKIFFKYYFLPTNLKSLPKNSYPEKFDYNYQKDLIKKFEVKEKQSSFMSCPHLISLLSTKFSFDQEFSFLDVGGERIDFYLHLKKKFKNIKYYVFNQKNLLDVFFNIKSDFSLEGLNVISNISEIYNNQYDFVNFGASIQYIDNYEEFLNKITSNENKYIFFSAVTNYLSDNENYKKKMVVKQVNVFPQINYLYFLNKDYLYNVLFKQNYILLFEKKNTTDVINYDNFKNLLKAIEFTDIMFEKKFQK
tara:strand:- start:357 stop:1205 length:849 start_codon:yes stop_codon:yes gene_type:complete